MPDKISLSFVVEIDTLHSVGPLILVTGDSGLQIFKVFRLFTKVKAKRWPLLICLMNDHCQRWGGSWNDQMVLILDWVSGKI